MDLEIDFKKNSIQVFSDLNWIWKDGNCQKKKIKARESICNIEIV